MESSTSSHQRLGVVMMATAVMTIPLADTIAKWLSAGLSVGEIATFRFVFQSLFLLPFVVAFRRNGGPRGEYAVLGVLIAASILFLFWGLKHLPLANNIALFFVEPLILVIFSRLFLGERITLRRWIGVTAGLVGALIIIRPNWSVYGLTSLLPIAAATCYAAYLTASRALVRTHHHSEALILQFWVGLAAAGVMGLFLAVGQPPGWEIAALSTPQGLEWVLLILAGGLAAFAHVLIVMAFARAEASILAPLQYLEIFGATLLGWWVFNDLSDAFTALGAVIIVAAGVYVVREMSVASQPVSD